VPEDQVKLTAKELDEDVSELRNVEISSPCGTPSHPPRALQGLDGEQPAGRHERRRLQLSEDRPRVQGPSRAARTSTVAFRVSLGGQRHRDDDSEDAAGVRAREGVPAARWRSGGASCSAPRRRRASPS